MSQNNIIKFVRPSETPVIETDNAELNAVIMNALKDYEENQRQEKLQRKRELKEQRLNSTKTSVDCTTDPIKDLEDIKKAKEYFLQQPLRYKTPTNIRNYALFVFGCNTARRISDILRFQISDVYDSYNNSIKTRIKLVEKKTGKIATIFLNESVREALMMYLNSLETFSTNDPLFKSRKGGAINERSAWRIMKDMSRAIGLEEKGINVGTHTMRKTFAYHILKQGNNDNITIATLKEILNHSSEETTKRYCGIREDEIKEVYLNNQV